MVEDVGNEGCHTPKIWDFRVIGAGALELPFTFTPGPTYTPTPSPTHTLTPDPAVPSPTPTPTLTRTRLVVHITVQVPPTPTRPPTPRITPPRLEISGTSARPGNRITVEVRLRSNGVAVAGTENELVFPSQATISDCRIDPEIDKRASAIVHQPYGCSVTAGTCTSVKALIFAADNTAPIADGSVLYRCTVQVASTAAAGTYRLSIEKGRASTPDGKLLELVGDAGEITVTLAGRAEEAAVVRQAPGGGPAFVGSDAGGCSLGAAATPRSMSWPLVSLALLALLRRRVRPRPASRDPRRGRPPAHTPQGPPHHALREGVPPGD